MFHKGTFVHTARHGLFQKAAVNFIELWDFAKFDRQLTFLPKLKSFRLFIK